jgi:hypothetical protein
MGQAKQRKAEITALKESKTTVRFLAIRHTEDGEREFCHGEASIGKPVNSKNALLRHICVNNWLHNPPAGEIAEYLIQTNTYADMKMFNKEKEMAYVINFYEVDSEMSIRQGSKTYSCREIWAMTPDKVKEYAVMLADELKAAGDYSIKEHA